MTLPLVAIVGAPNVGKSTLFNRLVRRRRAIVTDEPGVTRDRLYGEVRDVDRPFRLVDTGGLAQSRRTPFAGEIEEQALRAMDEAAVILLVIDVRAGASAHDRELAAQMRRRDIPVILVANKVDSVKTEPLVNELHELGVGQPFPVSAEHSLGVSELIEAIERALGETESDDGAQPGARALNVAIVGRPNVGKSSLVNRLVGEQRVVVSEIPGTTRDAIDTLLEMEGRRYRLIDTAGIRRRGKVQLRVERFSVSRARQNIGGCDVAVLVLDASESLAAQDAHIAGYISDAYKPMVIAVNKWDLIEGREAEAKRWQEQVRDRLRFAKEVPMVLVSALSGQRVSRILDLVDRGHEQSGITVPTSDLNRWLVEIAGPNRDEGGIRDRLRLYYATQTGVHPPSFVLFCNDPRKVHFSFNRRLSNSLRERYGFGGAPIRLQFRRRTEGRKS